jgi:hypothetical protein
MCRPVVAAQRPAPREDEDVVTAVERAADDLFGVAPTEPPQVHDHAPRG